MTTDGLCVRRNAAKLSWPNRKSRMWAVTTAKPSCSTVLFSTSTRSSLLLTTATIGGGAPVGAIRRNIANSRPFANASGGRESLPEVRLPAAGQRVNTQGPLDRSRIAGLELLFHIEPQDV